jgi:signal transduction histidine kinase
MRFNSLSFRLFVTAAAWTLIVLPIAGMIIYQLYRDDVQASFDGRIEKLVNAIAIDSLSSGGNQPVTPVNRYEPLFEETQSGWYWQIRPLDDVTGNRLVSASLATAALPSPIEENVKPDANGARWMNTTGPVGEPIRMVEVVDTNNHVENAGRYSVIVAGPVDWLETRNRTFLARLAVALALSGLGLLAVTLFQIRFGLLPLRAIENGLTDIRSGKAARLEGELPVEIEPLQTELNALLRSNQEIVERARTQVGNLAHALKTPLAVITNEAREDKSALGAKVAEQAALMRDQVSHYLDRARMAARVSVIGRVTDVASVVQPLQRALERIHRDRSISIVVDCPPNQRFQGEQHDLEEMLGNLLDNACKWARAKVYLTVAKKQRESRDPRTGPSRLVLTVEDDGPGLTPEERKRIGKRGLRLDETKPGSGLGLSIVTELVQQYHGEFELDQSAHGGLAVRIELPAV